MKKCLIPFLYFSLIFSGNAFCAESYTTPPAFMALYFAFTGNHEDDFPANQQTISQLLLKSLEAKKNVFAGDLVLLLDSSLYVYNQQRQLVYKQMLRTNRHTGFFELTAVSHVGPALAYLAKLKENGDPSWQPAMANLLEAIKSVKTLNAQTENNWLDKANIHPWALHKQAIHNMVDYAMSMAGNYIVAVQKGQPFDLAHVQKDFLNGNAQYPIPYNSVMVGTFMLTGIQSMMSVHDEINALKIDWSKAMVIVRNVAGGNSTAGVTEGTNWMVPFIHALSGNKLPASRLFVAPYAKVLPEVGESLLPEKAYQYYVQGVFGSVYNRRAIANAVFTDLETIYLPPRPALPGDYQYSTANDINDFLVRLKHSLADPREMLSNTVGFWLAGELPQKNWDMTNVDIPGLTTGFPAGVSEYPKNNPEIMVH